MTTLSDDDRDCLAGAHGPAAAFAMRLIVRFAQAVEAPRLIDCTSAHIDGCLYHGRASLDFVERFVELKGRVKVPTTLNVGSMDLIHPELFIGGDDLRRDGTRLMKAHEELGCVPTFTCAPYQTIFRPRLGDQIAWAESNAIVFANSVIGARTNRYGDFIDLACAMVGRVPDYGLHRTENRRARQVLAIDAIPHGWPTDIIAIAAGHALGKRAGDVVTAIVGLPPETTEDDLKGLGAVAASSGAVGLFHAVGLTPEAPTLEAATHGEAVPVLARLSADDLREIVTNLSTVPVGTKLSAVSLGTPHFSRAQFADMLALMDGRRFRTDVYVNTGRDIHADLIASGDAARLEAAGVTLVVDTCTYVTAIMRDLSGAVMTNSGKMAYYAPGNLDIDIAFGSLADCIASAQAGQVVRA